MAKPQVVEIADWQALAKAGTAPDDALLRKILGETQIEPVPGDAPIIDFIISSAAVDRDRDIVDPSGWDFSFWQQNPVVPWAHDYDDPPVAKGLSIATVGTSVVARAEFTPADLYDFGWMIYRMIRGGFLRATSVGFRPLEWTFNEVRGGCDFSLQELYEFSVVTVGSNRDALALNAAKSAGIDIAPMKAWAEKALDTWHGGSGLWVAKSDLEEAFKLAAKERVAVAVPAAVEADAVAADQGEDKAAEPTEAKRGRVLNAANETAIRKACEHADEVLKQLTTVLDQCADEETDGAPTGDVVSKLTVRINTDEVLAAVEEALRRHAAGDAADRAVTLPEVAVAAPTGVSADEVKAAVDAAIADGMKGLRSAMTALTGKLYDK